MPLHKKGGKNGKKLLRKSRIPKRKNDEKQQKVSRNKSKKQSDLSSNTLNNKYLAKNATNTNKKTIDINKTTTATTEEKEAAAADALSSPQTTPAPIEPWHTLIDKLTEESAWLDVACMHSGYGSLLKTHIKEAVEVFRQHVILHDNGNVLLNMKDTRQYFVNFVRAGQRTSQELHMLLQGLENAAVCRRTAQPLPLRAAGERTAHLPGLPHPRRSATPTGQYRLLERNCPFVDVANPAAFIEKGRNRNPAETPHSGIRNATRQRSECHMSTFRMPHLSTSQVWHLPS